MREMRAQDNENLYFKKISLTDGTIFVQNKFPASTTGLTNFYLRLELPILWLQQ